MFGAKPYQFEPTHGPGEEPALHREGEERSAYPNLYGLVCLKEMYFYDEQRLVLSFPGAGHSE